MNEEIREILKILKKCEFGACITKHNSRVLLDYITNLQKEVIVNNDLIPHFKNRVKELKKEITNLQKENEKLRMRNDMLRKDIDSFIQDNKIDYKSRVEKAIEYIKENATSNYFDGKINMLRREVDLLNILQNGSVDND